MRYVHVVGADVDVIFLTSRFYGENPLISSSTAEEKKPLIH